MTTIQITLHDNTAILTQVESYNATNLTSLLNDPKLLMVQFGNAIVNKNSVKVIVEVQQ